MKKVLLTVSFTALTGLIFGQITSKSLGRDHAISVMENVNVVNAERAVIWTNDFSTPADWATTNTGTPPANWSIGTAAPTGFYSDGMGPIASTTAANNFALFDSDALGSETSAQNAVLQIVAPIDLSANPAVLVEFQSYYRAFDGQCFLEVSNDGTTWTQYPVHTDVPTNVSTTNPTTVSVNVTAVIGGEATAYIRFRYVGLWDYAWMIDDIQIVDAPDNELILTSTFAGIYTKYPLGQERPVTLSGKVLNNGATAQTDVTLTVKENGTTIGTSTAIPSLAVVATDSLTAAAAYEPSGLGVKNLEYTVSQTETDAVPANNTVTRSIEVTNYIFSRDRNVYTGTGYTQLVIGANSDPVKAAGIYYEIIEDAQATSATVVLDGLSNVGAEFKAELFEDDGVDLISLGESDLHPLVASEINDSSTNAPVAVTVKFFAPIDLEAGGLYFLAIWEESDTVSIAYDNQNRSEDVLVFSGGDWGGIIDGGFIPLIRLNLNEPDNSAIQENSVASNVSVFPNPATEVLNVTFSEMSGDATLTMFSTDGKQVMNKNINIVANQTSTLDVTSLSAGVYTLRVVSTNGTTSKKVIIK